MRKRTVHAVDGRQHVAKVGVAQVRNDLRGGLGNAAREAEGIHRPLQVPVPLVLLQRQPLTQRRLIHLYMRCSSVSLSFGNNKPLLSGTTVVRGSKRSVLHIL